MLRTALLTTLLLASALLALPAASARTCLATVAGQGVDCKGTEWYDQNLNGHQEQCLSDGAFGSFVCFDGVPGTWECLADTGRVGVGCQNGQGTYCVVTQPDLCVVT